jgi:UDP-N-acetylglucosamine 2-epimerase (hydrolysing)
MKKTKKRKIVFISATRADFGKIKSIISLLNKERDFEVHIFATGMHMSEKHGMTVNEITKSNFKNVYRYINGAHLNHLDETLASTISGFGQYVKIIRPDLIVVHGDRSEAIAGALVGSLNNIPVAHIEGGEVSGTVDEHIRHSTTKLSHLHFVSNLKAKRRLIQMGERKEHIFVIGSPDLDLMTSKNLPRLEAVKRRYQIPFKMYGIVVFHPVTTEIEDLSRQTNILVDALIESKAKYVVVFPNNDTGSEIILEIYKRKILDNPNFRVFPSIRFEYFLTLLKNARCLVGNSSAGIREAPFYGVPSINVGSRQNGRAEKNIPSVLHLDFSKKDLVNALSQYTANEFRYRPNTQFGNGNSARKFLEICRKPSFWDIKIQKQFLDLE